MFEFRRLAASAAIVFFMTCSLAAVQTAQKPAAPKPQTTPKTALPPAVEKSFKDAYPNAVIKNVTKEKLSGKDVYEVESIDAGKQRDIIYRPDGVIAVLEETIPVGDVPAAVIAAIKKDHPKGTVTRYEKSIQDGVVTYEIQLKGAKVGSAEYTPEGKPVK